ncbi:MAG: amidohydrolase family protein [Firmicutes bacterium]|nr:amidohydrolase family protein [Bacillota bacterium]
MIYIENSNIVTEKGILKNGALLCEKGIITKIGKPDSFKAPKNAEIIDANGLYLGPGFVDIHVHGGNGYNFFDNPEKAAKYFLKHGETTVLATSYTTYTKAEYLTAIEKIKKAMNSNSKNIAGFYMEGPYLNPKYGAEPKMNKWLGEIKEEDYSQIVDNVGDLAKVWAVAPERDGMVDFMEYVKSKNQNAVFAVAHSEATPDEIDRVKNYGIKIQTHCMNATGRMGESKGIRGVGPDEYCLMSDDMYAEMICDSLAIHVPAYLQRLILKIKGIDKIILITDSFATNSEESEKYAKAKDLSFDSDGNLSGSRLTMDTVCQNFVKHTNSSISDTFLAAATNPAKSMGMYDEIGSIEVGKKANLVIVDKDFNIDKVIFEGVVQC